MNDALLALAEEYELYRVAYLTILQAGQTGGQS